MYNNFIEWKIHEYNTNTVHVYTIKPTRKNFISKCGGSILDIIAENLEQLSTQKE